MNHAAAAPAPQTACCSPNPAIPTHPLQPSPLQWAVTSVTNFQTIAFVVPEGCQLASLSLCSQRPLCLAAASLARCTRMSASARRVYLGLPLRRGAPWADVDELAARWAQVSGRGWDGSAAVCRQDCGVRVHRSAACSLGASAACICADVSLGLPTSPPASTQFMLGGTLEAVEITATRFFVFQPVQGAC